MLLLMDSVCLLCNHSQGLVVQGPHDTGIGRQCVGQSEDEVLQVDQCAWKRAILLQQCVHILESYYPIFLPLSGELYVWFQAVQVIIELLIMANTQMCVSVIYVHIPQL